MTVSFFAQYEGMIEDNIEKCRKFGEEFAFYMSELDMQCQSDDKRMRFYSDSLEVTMEFMPAEIRKISISGKNEVLHKSLLQELYREIGISVYEAKD